MPFANAATVTNYCAKKSDGTVRSIQTGKCASSEYSLGATAIAQPKTRPKGVVWSLMERYLAAKASAKKHGYYLRITSGFRRLSDQEYLFRQAVKKYRSEAEAAKWVLPGGMSTHTWGIALDVNFRTKLKKGAQWLDTNGYKWGLCRVYDNEWWHFEGTGIPGQKCPKRWKDAMQRFPDALKK
jgi:D-alanyl-D-alanine dipeptidase